MRRFPRYSSNKKALAKAGAFFIIPKKIGCMTFQRHACNNAMLKKSNDFFSEDSFNFIVLLFFSDMPDFVVHTPPAFGKRYIHDPSHFLE